MPHEPGFAARRRRTRCASLADETDGRAIVNRNDLAQGLQQIVRDSSAYYLLGYNSTQAPSDGKFHEIKVRVKRPGVQVRARKGYWALTAAETRTAMAPPSPDRRPSRSQVARRHRRRASDRRATCAPGSARRRATRGKTKVTLVWEPLPPAPGSERGETRRPRRR